MPDHLAATPLLDLDHPALRTLVRERGWQDLATPDERIRAAYDFVRDEIGFGYNLSDDIPASAVLADGHGQCNTKATLLMALLRILGIPCRLHGGAIDKALQRGAIAGIWFTMAPARILHTWVEVWFNDAWVGLEGVILDLPYLGAVQAIAQRDQPGCARFLGYGVATDDIAAPPVSWRGCATAIQAEGLAEDYGVFSSPDDFYAIYGANMGMLRRQLYRHVVRARLNAQVARVRAGKA